MQGLRQRGGIDLFRRHGALILILACWAVQAVGYWLVHSPLQADAAEEREEESRSMNFERLQVLKKEIAMVQRNHQGEKMKNE